MPTTDPKNTELWLRLGQKLEALLPPSPPPIDFSSQLAFRWIRRATLLGHISFLQPVASFAKIDLEDLQHVESQAQRVVKNTRQFVCGLPANNVLLTGARGTGKSSLVRACLSAFGDAGLRLIEIDKDDLADLPQLAELIGERPERFIIFCDDLSFEQGDAGYKALKTVLDGGLSAQSDNMLIYATSNRRHLMPESMKDNLAVQYDEDGDLHPGETIEERISLSERFGLWVSFHSFNQADYLDIVMYWLTKYGMQANEIEAARPAALQWATERGSRSGRVALAFAKDWVAQKNTSATE